MLRHDRTRPGGRRAIAVVAGVALAVVSAVLVAVPVAAEPVPSTITVGFTDAFDVKAMRIRVTADPTVAPTGLVTVSEGGVELARATLTPYDVSTIDYGQALVHLDLAPGLHILALDYLGSAGELPTSASSTHFVERGAPPYLHPATGTLQVGAVTAPLSARSSFYGNDPLYDPLSGAVQSSTRTYGSVDLSADVAGVGAVTLSVRPRFGGQPTWVRSDGSVFAWPGTASLDIDRITVEGVTWSHPCSATAGSWATTGAVDATGLALVATAVVTPVSTADCGGRGDLVNAVLAAPVTLRVHVDGTFPLPPAPNTPTTTTVAVTPDTGLTIPERVRATATVSAPGHQPSGTVTFKDGGVPVGSANVGADGAATAWFTLTTAGPHEITAEYGGFAVTLLSTVVLLSPSSASTTVELAADAPVGRPVSGSFTSATQPASVLPAGSLLTGAAFDPVSGAIGSGRMWFPPGELTVDTPIGAAPVQFRLVQLEDFTGQVAPDGAVAFTPADFRLEAWTYKLGATWSSLGECTFGPVEVTLTGTADAAGLHLAQSDVSFPPLPSSGCAGYASYVNPDMTDTDFAFEVEGDFSLLTEGTSTGVVSWFPAVAVRNQTYLTASVASVVGPPTGEVVFRDADADTVLGSAVVDGAGHASIVATMDVAGARTITATYHGDAGQGTSQGSTTVEVTPQPDGYDLGGSLQVGGVSIPVPEGSRLMPASSGEGWSVDGLSGLQALGLAVSGATTSSGGWLWVVPTAVSLDVPGYGPVTAEVRLVQAGEFGSGSILGDGSIQGLGGSYVLHVRRVTTAQGTSTPLGCVNLVLMSFDGKLTYDDVSLATAAGGSGRIPWPTCTGPGRAVAEALAGGAAAQLQASF